MDLFKKHTFMSHFSPWLCSLVLPSSMGPCLEKAKKTLIDKLSIELLPPNFLNSFPKVLEVVEFLHRFWWNLFLFICFIGKVWSQTKKSRKLSNLEWPDLISPKICSLCFGNRVRCIFSNLKLNTSSHSMKLGKCFHCFDSDQSRLQKSMSSKMKAEKNQFSDVWFSSYWTNFRGLSHVCVKASMKTALTHRRCLLLD